jgi:hypothetical protein
MPALTAPQTASALARLEGLHTMLTLDEAIEILTGKKLPLRNDTRDRTSGAGDIALESSISRR